MSVQSCVRFRVEVWALPREIWKAQTVDDFSWSDKHTGSQERSACRAQGVVWYRPQFCRTPKGRQTHQSHNVSPGKWFWLSLSYYMVKRVYRVLLPPMSYHCVRYWVRKGDERWGKSGESFASSMNRKLWSGCVESRRRSENTPCFFSVKQERFRSSWVCFRF